MRLTRVQQGSIAATAAALLYALTLAPTVGAGDSGELVLAAQGLGVAHPPGYPLWLLVARLASTIPAGGLALRVNAVSALSTAVAVGLFWLLARRSGLRPAAASVATVCFATASIVWSAAVEAEVYGFAALAFVALALLALRARRAGASLRDEALFFFAAGLATVVHQTLLFPSAAWGVWLLLRRGPRVSRLAAAAGWAAAGASLSLVIPIRWSAGPAFAWTEVRGLPGLADYLLRRTYGGLAQNPFRLDRAVDEAAGMGALVLGSLGWLAAALAAAGFLLSPRARRTVGPVTIAALTIPAALIIWIAFTPDAEHLAQIAPFLVPLIAAAALLAGSGAQSIARRVPRPGRGAVTAALLLAVLALVPSRYAAADRSGYTLAERYGRDLLRAAPRRATLVLDGDNETFLTAYAARERATRRDVVLRHRRGWIFGDAYGLRRLPRSAWAAAARDAELKRIARGERLCYAIPPSDLIEAGVLFTQRGLLYEARGTACREEEAWTLPAAWPRSSDLLGGHPERYDYVTRKMAVSYSDAAARWHWDHGRPEAALPWFLDAARVAYDVPGAHLNAATALAAVGRPEAALDELLLSCRLAPYDAEPPARLAIFLAAAGRPRDAAVWFERAFRVEPKAAIAADVSRAWSLAGERERALEWSRCAAQLGRSG